MKKILISILAMFLFVACAAQPEVGEPGQDALGDGTAETDVVVSDVDEKIDMVNTSEENADSSSSDSSLNTVYFDFDEYAINDNNMEIITTNSNSLLNSNENIKLEGNCDEWGSDEYNYALGLKRTKSVKDTLISLGVDESKISMVSYGESKPVCDEKTKSCWGKNRRVDTILLP